MADWYDMRERAKAEAHFRTSMHKRDRESVHTVAHFRQLDDGSTLFYPPGAFGRHGYRVESGHQERRLRRAAGIYRNLCIAVGIGLGFLVMAVDLHEWPALYEAAAFVGS